MSARKRLKAARKQRHRIAHQFRLLDSGAVSLEDYLREPGELSRVAVCDVLRRAPKLGREGTKKVLQHTKIWPLDRLGDLSDDDRARIISALPMRARAMPRTPGGTHTHDASRDTSTAS